MTTYYVVGGGTGGFVDLGSSAYYSLTSGGAGGAGFPTSSDDVILNTASGTNFTVTGSGSFLSFTCGTSSTPIFNGAFISCTDGNLTLVATNTVASVGSGGSGGVFSLLRNTAGTSTINLANINLQGLVSVTVQASAVGAIANLAGAINNADTVQLDVFSGGTVSTAGFAVSTLEGASGASGITISNSVFSPGTITLGASTLTTDNFSVSGDPSTPLGINLNSATIITRRQADFYSGFTASTSTVRMLTTATYSNESILTLSGSSNLNVVQLQGDKNILASIGPTIATLTKTTNANINGVLELVSDITVTGTATFTGNSVINRLLVTSQNLTSPYTLSAATTSITNTDFRDITAAGTAAWTGTSVGNWLGNTGITFTPAVTRFAVAVVGSVDWTSTAIWSATSGGAGGATVPLAQDNAVINNLSGSGELRVTNTNAMCADLTVGTGYAGSLIINRSAYVFGSITTANEINVTRSLPETITLASRGTVNLSYGNRTLIGVIVQGPTTTNINANLGSPEFNTNEFLVVTGTFNTNGFTIYTSYLANAGGTIALGTSEIFAYSTCTLGLMSANTASIYLMNSVTINGTYLFNVNIAATFTGRTISIADGGGPVTLYGTITDRNPNYPSTQNYSYGSGSVTFTTNSVWDLANGSGRIVTINGTNFINNSTRSLQTLTATFQDCTASGTFSGVDFNAFGLANLGGNTGITFPSRLKTYAYRNLGGQTFTIPEDFTGTFAKVIAIGPGGSGVTGSGGGGGGAYAEAILSGLTAGQTLYVSDTSAGNTEAFISKTASAPTLGNGVLAKAGSSGTIRTGGLASASVGTIKYSGGNGGSGPRSGAGGGSSATSTNNGFNAGSSASGFGIGGTGGAGLTGTSSATTNENGSAGGNPLGGAAGVGGISNTAGGNATAGSGGGGGGGGASYSVTNTTKTGTYTRASASTTLVLDITNHEMISGQSYQYNFAIPFNSGSYSKPNPSAGAPVTITTSTPHGLTSGQFVYIDFISGLAGARDGMYTVSVTGLSTFVVIIGLSTTASGTVNLHPAAPTSTFATTVINPNQVSITTASNCPMPTTNVSATVPIIAYDNAGAAGGSSSYREDYTFDYLNTIRLVGTTGPAGGTGGGASSLNFAGGNAGIRSTDGYPVGGGGGSGGTGSTNGTSSAGYPGLVLFSYYVAPPPSQGYIIG
jgi:hypothetical protein